MKLPLNLAIYATPPSPVVLVSTVDMEGNKNLAPFGFFEPCSHMPPMLCFGARKKLDTYKNIMATKEFVVGIPTPDIAAALYKCSDDVPDEFTHSGLTPVESAAVKPFRVKECQANFECKLEWEKECGDHVLVVGRVVEADVDKSVFAEDKVGLRTKLKPLYHVSNNHFVSGGGKHEAV